MNKLKNRFFAGRIGRADYFWISVTGGLLIKGAEFVINGTKSPIVLIGLLGLQILALGVVLSASVRRAHDLGHSGWLTLILIIPLSSFYFLFAPGQKVANKWGPSPSGHVESEAVNSDA